VVTEDNLKDYTPAKGYLEPAPESSAVTADTGREPANCATS
jgi:hypothetical protein